MPPPHTRRALRRRQLSRQRAPARARRHRRRPKHHHRPNEQPSGGARASTGTGRACSCPSPRRADKRLIDERACRTTAGRARQSHDDRVHRKAGDRPSGAGARTQRLSARAASPPSYSHRRRAVRTPLRHTRALKPVTQRARSHRLGLDTNAERGANTQQRGSTSNSSKARAF